MTPPNLSLLTGAIRSEQGLLVSTFRIWTPWGLESRGSLGYVLLRILLLSCWTEVHLSPGHLGREFKQDVLINVEKLALGERMEGGPGVQPLLGSEMPVLLQWPTSSYQHDIHCLVRS